MRAPHAVAVLVLGCAMGLSGLPSPAAAQVAEAPDWTVPRTEYGHPDIQGRWSNGFVTPLQRPEGREPTLTQEEVAQAEQRASNFLENSFEPLDPDRAAPEATTNPGAYDLYTEPWGGEIPMWQQNEQMYEYACHEANYGMFNILRGARYQER